MPDMLVRLYALPDAREALHAVQARGIAIRRPSAHERTALLAWVREQFSDRWSGECALAFAATTPSCFIACADRAIVGFACHDCTRRNFFGPAGVAVHARGRGIGRALLLASLHAMHANGYAYAIIGGVGPQAFYAKAVGATLIDDSTPGSYAVPSAPSAG